MHCIVDNVIDYFFAVEDVEMLESTGNKSDAEEMSLDKNGKYSCIYCKWIISCR